MLHAFHVNAFTDVPYSGNPATVIVNAQGLSKAQKQIIAREVNTPETMFIDGCSSSMMRLNFFTPIREVPACGHGTIAAAHVATRMKGGDSPIRFQTAIGEIRIEGAQNRYRMISGQKWAIRDTYLTDSLADALQYRPQGPIICAQTKGGLPRLLIQVEALETLTPDFTKLKTALEAEGLSGLFAFTIDDAAFSSFRGRMFAPPLGINEDVVNGNASLALGAWVRSRPNAPERIDIRQGDALGRPGTVTVYPYDNSLEGHACSVYAFELASP